MRKLPKITKTMQLTLTNDALREQLAEARAQRDEARAQLMHTQGKIDRLREEDKKAQETLQMTRKRLRDAHVRLTEAGLMADALIGETRARADYWRTAFQGFVEQRMLKVLRRAEHDETYEFVLAVQCEGDTFSPKAAARLAPDVTIYNVVKLCEELGLPTPQFDIVSRADDRDADTTPPETPAPTPKV